MTNLIGYFGGYPDFCFQNFENPDLMSHVHVQKTHFRQGSQKFDGFFEGPQKVTL